ncbi:MAG: hypothetical protein AAGJ35_07685, partial [Myxococcota bacterium]
FCTNTEQQLNYKSKTRNTKLLLPQTQDNRSTQCKQLFAPSEGDPSVHMLGNSNIGPSLGTWPM